MLYIIVCTLVCTLILMTASKHRRHRRRRHLHLLSHMTSTGKIKQVQRAGTTCLTIYANILSKSILIEIHTPFHF